MYLRRQAQKQASSVSSYENNNENSSSMKGLFYRRSAQM